jgi:A/G-specific adenine glycosylase
MKKQEQFALFRESIWAYYRKHGRHDAPWRNTHDPYRILISEFMLQQTQVSRVLIKYPEFLKRFPTLKTLAAASLRDVLIAWQGLGYNRRARSLKRLSEIIVRDYGGRIPRQLAALLALPGVGPSTAGGILAFAFETGVPYIETNIRRVYLSFFFPKKKNVSDKVLLQLIEETLDTKKPREWYYALMDYGVMLGKTRPNANIRSAHYTIQPRFKGSVREARGRILRELTKKRRLSIGGLSGALGIKRAVSRTICLGLVRDGLVKINKDWVTIAS